MADYTMPAASFRQQPDRQSHCPYNDITSLAQLPDSYAQTPASTTDDMAFVPWLFEVPPYDTPLSRASSHSGSGYISTPQSLMDIDQTPMYHIEHSAPASIDFLVRGSGYTNDHEFTCPSHTMGSGRDVSQPPFTHAPLPLWPSTDHGGPLPPMDLHRRSTTYYDSCRFRRSILSTIRGPSNADGSTVSSVTDSDDSDNDDDGSSYSRGNQSGSKPSNAIDSSAASVLKLGKWSMLDPFTQPPQRIYICPLHAKSGPTGTRCEQRFVRPEHLRRHMKTTHGTLRPHPCKVPGCDKKFSRGDNLRDHYWTHIHRGGRIGKNQKMSLLELKEILGPREKKLIRKLKEKLLKAKSQEWLQTLIKP